MLKKLYILAIGIISFIPSFAQIDIIVGTGTTSTSSYPAPYGNLYESSRHQMLIKASELNALGAPGNVINALSFQVDVSQTNPLLNVQIKMGHTSASTLSTFITAGMTSVYNANSFTTNTGWNLHTFSNNFVWNGIDNIVVEFCFDNISIGWDDNATMYYTNVGFNSTLYNRDDGVNMCGDPSIDGTSQNRPNMKLSFLPSGNYNLTVNKINAPISGCFLEDSVKVRVFNFGTNDTTNFDISYVLDGIPVTETVTKNITANSFIDYTFATPLTYVGAGPYALKVYTSFAPDTVKNNDTINATITQSAIGITAPFLETFSTIADGATGNLTNGWTISGQNSFAWFAETTTTSSSGTGPNNDHTTGTGTYLFTEASSGNTGSEATITTPCIDISNLVAPRLSFWYHKFGSNMGDLFVDVEYKGQWINNVFTIVGQTQISNAAAWLEADLNLINYVGTNIKLRFRGKRGNSFEGDMAIDDVKIYEPSPNDIQVNSILSQILGCGLNSTDSIVVLLENRGSAPITSLSVGYSVNGIAITPETISQTIAPGNSIIYTFNTSANLSGVGVQKIKAYATLSGDPNAFNDTISKSVTAENTISAPFTETFDGINDNQTGMMTNGWNATTSNLFAWRSETTNTFTSSTGPSGDHTSGSGTFMFTEASNGNTGDEAQLYSPCIDLSTVANPYLSFWSHKYGANMGDITVDVFDGDKWNLNATTILGQTHFNTTDSWTKITTSLIPYAGKSIKLRFRSTRGNGSLGDMAIDDVKIYDALANNAMLSAAVSPNSACGLTTTENISFEILNAGYDTIQSIKVYYSINGNTPIMETVNTTIKPDSAFTYTFSTQANLGTAGTYNISMYVELAGEQNMLNDTIKYSLDNFVSPNNPILSNLGTVCVGNTSTLNAVGNGLIFWYNSATNKTPLDTGITFVTDILNTNKTFYAQASMGDKIAVGPMAVFSGNSTYANAGGLKFDVQNSDGVIIESIDVNANTAGAVTVSIWNSLNINILTKTITVNSGLNTLSLFTHVPMGTGYKMLLMASGTTTTLQRDNTASFPYSIPNQLSIVDGTNPGNYYFFYNWKIRNQQCSSARVSILQEVGDLPVKLGKDTLICRTQSLILDAGPDFGYDYVWSVDTTISSQTFNINGANYPNDTTILVSVVVNDIAKNCSGTDKIYISINLCSGLEDDLFQNVSVYPNPTKGNVFIDLNYFEGADLNIQLINNLGQVVENKFVSNNKGIVALDISNNSNGIYYLRLQSDNHSKTYKMVIE